MRAPAPLQEVAGGALRGVGVRAADLIADEPGGQVATGLALVLVLVVLSLVAVAVRRRVLQRSYGTIDCSLRLRTQSAGRGWSLGVGRFEGDVLQWYRVFSFAPRPRRVLSRSSLEVVGRREPRSPESLSLLKGAVVLECRSGSDPVELAMDPAAVPGFLAWLEARPPEALRG